MKKIFSSIFFLFVFFQFSCSGNLKTIDLSYYGDLSDNHISETMRKAMDDINGKKLVFPSQKLLLDTIRVKDKSNFSIVGKNGNEINCSIFKIENCSGFEVSKLFIKGTKKKFSRFDVVGSCHDFSIHDCWFDSEKDAENNNMFYGIHVKGVRNKEGDTYKNATRNFKIYNNTVRNARYDGILVHAYCSDFVVENNVIDSAKCIGIEVEGRYGGLNSTTVCPCENAVIRNNKLRDCGDWGILLMWVGRIDVYGNVSKNARGAFLSIGCSKLKVWDNILEGWYKGFEISQEFYSVDKGINDGVEVFDNTIKGMAREENRAVVDIRHAKNISFHANKVSALYRNETSYISIASSNNVIVEKNTFTSETIPLKYSLIIDEVQDPEKHLIVKELDFHSCKIIGNKIPIKNRIKSNGLDLDKIKCTFKNNE